MDGRQALFSVTVAKHRFRGVHRRVLLEHYSYVYITRRKPATPFNRIELVLLKNVKRATTPGSRRGRATRPAGR